jgi:hypothetical protein
MAFLMPKEKVRLLEPGETIPSEMDAGFDLLGQLDYNWIWVLEYGKEIKGILVASNFHGIAFLWRLKVLPGMSTTAALKLLKRFKRDCFKRGVTGYLTLVDFSTVTGKNLMSIVARCGGKDHGQVNLVGSPLPRERG